MRWVKHWREHAAEAGDGMTRAIGTVHVLVLAPSDSDRAWLHGEPLLEVCPWEGDRDDEDFLDVFPEPIRVPLSAIREAVAEYDLARLDGASDG